MPSTRPTSWNGSATRRRHTAAALVEAELLLVEQRGQHHEPDERRRQERQAPPQALQRGDLLHRAPALGERRHGLLGVDHLVARARGRAFPPAAHRLAQPQREQREDQVGITNTRNGTRQPNVVREHARQ